MPGKVSIDGGIIWSSGGLLHGVEGKVFARGGLLQRVKPFLQLMKPSFHRREGTFHASEQRVLSGEGIFQDWKASL